MAKIFEFDNYRKFLSNHLNDLPHKGYGQLSQIAKHLNVHPTLVSQILKGKKDLTSDQAALVAEFFGLSEHESEYFVLLVHLSRAGNASSKTLYKRQLLRIKEKAQTISERVKVDFKLSEEHRAVFYSDWAYSAIRQAVALPGIDSVDSIASFLGLSREKVHRYVEFLIHVGLCRILKDKISVGPAKTHIEASSPWVRVHHSNWRNRAIHSLDRPSVADLHYTLPLTLSSDDAELVKEKLLQFIEQIKAIVDPSPSEAMYCLNLDWFQIAKG